MEPIENFTDECELAGDSHELSSEPSRKEDARPRTGTSSSRGPFQTTAFYEDVKQIPVSLCVFEVKRGSRSVCGDWTFNGRSLEPLFDPAALAELLAAEPELPQIGRIKQPAVPTRFRAGTVGRVMVYAARFELGFAIFHPADAKDYEAKHEAAVSARLRNSHYHSIKSRGASHAK